LGEIKEIALFHPPKMKQTRSTTVDISKSKNKKQSKGKLF
jgi:hypothetical protein